MKQEVLQELQAGSYKFSVVFNDERMTTAEDVINVNIYNPHPTVTEETEGEQAENVPAEGTEEVEEA